MIHSDASIAVLVWQGAGVALAGFAGVVRAGATDLLDPWADLHLRLLVAAEQL